MRMLWLKAGPLLPLDKGGNLRTWHLMRHLAARHEITYLSFAPPDQPQSDVADMRAVAARVETVPRREAVKGSFRFYADVALHLFDPLPFAVGRYRSQAYRSRVRSVLASGNFDLIVCDFLPPAVSLPRSLPCPAVLFTHNVEAEIWRRHADIAPNELRRWLYRIQHRRMLRFEGRTLRRFHGVLTVSEADRRTFARLYPQGSQPVRVIPTGVDTGYFTRSHQEEPPRPRHLVFTGSMDWLPNEDAMLHFCRDILPRVQAEEPETTLTVVGRAPTAAVQALATVRGVTVTGRVEDVRPFIRDAAVYVVPLRIGGGTRLKIFEAMAMGKAVVSTVVGAEGLPIVDGTHLVLADEPAAFAHAVVALLRHPERRLALEEAARALVVERYDWSAIAASFEDTLVRFAAPLSGPAGTHATSVGAATRAMPLTSGWREAPAARQGDQ